MNKILEMHIQQHVSLMAIRFQVTQDSFLTWRVAPLHCNCEVHCVKTQLYIHTLTENVKTQELA